VRAARPSPARKLRPDPVGWSWAGFFQPEITKKNFGPARTRPEKCSPLPVACCRRPRDESRTCARSSSPLRGCELRLPALLGAPPLQLPICDHPDPPQSSVDWRSPSAAAHFSPVAAANRSSPEVAAHRSTYIVAWADLMQAVGTGPWHCSKSSSSCGCGEREDV
jgi:hypothetical protein